MRDQQLQLQLRLFEFPSPDEPAQGDTVPSAAPPAPPRQAALPPSPADLHAVSKAAPSAEDLSSQTHKAAPTKVKKRAVEAPPQRASEAGEEEDERTEKVHLNGHNPPGPGAEASPPGGVIMVRGIPFHHASEAEFARLLNYYGIEWQYEPHQFPLQWRDGRPTEMFTPDFYLTEYDLYIELTTMRQSLVRRKNRKLRVLRALYPDVNIKLLYRRDYQRLLERFGIRPEELEAEMPPEGSDRGGEE